MKESKDLTKRMIAEHIENWLLNRDYHLKPSQPLTLTQISYIAWEVFRFKIGRQTLGRHYAKCLGAPEIPHGKGWMKQRNMKSSGYRPYGNKYRCKKKDFI